MHEYYLNTLKIPEEKIPAVYRKVAAEMIRCNTSLAVRRRLAGEHQAKQHDAHGATSSDNVAAFMRACRDKRAKLNDPFLTDNKVWMVIKTIGLDRDKAFDKLKKKKPNESEQVLREREWYATLKLTRNSAYFFSQRDNLIASWRSLAMFCCSCIDIPEDPLHQQWTGRGVQALISARERVDSEGLAAVWYLVDAAKGIDYSKNQQRVGPAIPLEMGLLACVRGT